MGSEYDLSMGRGCLDDKIEFCQLCGIGTDCLGAVDPECHVKAVLEGPVAAGNDSDPGTVLIGHQWLYPVSFHHSDPWIVCKLLWHGCIGCFDPQCGQCGHQ